MSANLDSIESETKSLKDEFEQYREFWEKDAKEKFEQFLIDNEPKENPFENEDDQNSSKENPLLKGCRVKIPNLDLFDERIKDLKSK